MKYKRDEHGIIHIPNPAAYSFPAISLEREIGGTVYTVTCSFDGKEQLKDKYQRIILQNLSKKESEKHDNPS